MSEDILKKIVSYKKQEIHIARTKVPLSQIREAAEQRTDIRPFIEKLSNTGPGQINIIAEIKRASPSKGIICKDLDVAQYASQYTLGGASAISVLTDHQFFKGTMDDLAIVRENTELPVLRKDFLFTAYQIYESAVIGADAVLLIVRILAPEKLKELLELSHSLGLDALVEVHTHADLKVAKQVGARLIGINNRNLRSFETSITTTIEMASRLTEEQIGVALSGIQTKEDIAQICNAGINNFLIGESIVRSKQPAQFLKSLLKSV
jgi:indole-3-glycerol phosphate synthase